MGARHSPRVGAPAVELRGLTKTYAGAARPALDGVDLTLPAGTAFGLVGVNGAGKTTLIKTLLGIVRPSGGAVRVLGAPPDDTRARRRVGYLPERLDIPSAWTGLTFVTSVARLKGLDRPGARAVEAVERVGLSAAEARARTGRYSKGMRQRLGLAAALLGAPDLLVLDEPTDGIDPLGRAEMRRILMRERDRGAAILLNSHLLAETERVCDRVGILDAGRLVLEGALDELAVDGRGWAVRLEAGVDGAAFGLAAEPDGAWRFEADDPAAANRVLDEIRAAGGVVLGFEPRRVDLETVLESRVRGR